MKSHRIKSSYPYLSKHLIFFSIDDNISINYLLTHFWDLTNCWNSSWYLSPRIFKVDKMFSLSQLVTLDYVRC